jgi:hypothetical protein
VAADASDFALLALCEIEPNIFIGPPLPSGQLRRRRSRRRAANIDESGAFALSKSD